MFFWDSFFSSAFGVGVLESISPNDEAGAVS